VLGLRLAAFLTIRATMPFSFYEQALRQQVLQDLPDLHELIQPRRLGYESDNSQVCEQIPVPPGLRGAPGAHGNPDEMLGVPDLAQNVFSVTLGQVQVHQDQVWDCRIRVSAFPANEGEGGVSIGQADQFKSPILLVQSPPEKEDIRTVVFNDENPGWRNNRSVFQAYSQRPIIAASVSNVHPVKDAL
jgi:hypothetical protein